MTHNVISVSKIFNRRNMRFSAYQMLSFLDEQTLLNLHQSLSSGNNVDNNSYLLKLTQGLILTKKYLNKIDRSIYYYFYQENFIAQTDYYNTITLVQQNSTICSNILKKYNNLFGMLKSKCQMNQYQIEKLNQIVCDSDLALPNNLRQNVGKYCNSPYQFYLCSLLNSSSYGDIQTQTNFQNFKEIVNQKQQAYLKQILKYRNNYSEQEKESIKKIIKIRLHPQEVYETQNLIIEGFQIHNAISILLGLVDQILSTFKTYLNSIQNPFNRFVQVNLRYSIFRNFTIQAEQNFGFMFKAYNGIFEDGFNYTMPKEDFLLSKICMNKWKQCMIQEMKKVLPVYTYLTKQVRAKHLQIHFQQNNNLQQEMQEISCFIGSTAEDYFNNNPEGLSMCLEEFVQIFVDLSVDTSNINQCGHSKMQMGEIYKILQTKVINQSLKFAEELNQKQFQIEKIEEILQNQIKIVQKLNLKPVTLRRLCQQLKKMNELKGITVHYNFGQKDSILDNINRSPFKYSVSREEKQHGMVGSSITDDSSNNNSDNDQWEYNSEVSENQMFQQIETFEMEIE